MIKYGIEYIDKKDKLKRRKLIYMEVENLPELYKSLEKGNITHITNIEEVKWI